MKRLLSKNRRLAIIEAWDSKCAISGLANGSFGIELHVDHIIPLAEDGSNDFENLAPVFPRLNLLKGKERYPRELELFLLSQAKKKLPTVIKIYQRMSHKHVTFKNNLADTNIDLVIESMYQSRTWSLDDTKELVTIWIEKGVNGMKDMAIRFGKSQLQIRNKIISLGLYKSDYMGRA